MDEVNHLVFENTFSKTGRQSSSVLTFCCIHFSPPMKTILNLILCLAGMHAGAQGRVVINEYMPWTGNGCNTTSEFIELLNFGPGPVDIGCYILTEGDYAITIPPNTILQPGQYYVIAGQSILPAGCANIDSATTVHLNWNNCSNCVSAPIPSSGDGLFTDGGTASEQLVLLDPTLKVIDAVVRDIDLKEPSATLTTGASSGCAAQTFNLDQMTIHYEMIGESAGRGNSFARTVDGDCQWVKDTRQSANASNTKSGETSTVTYTLTYINAKECNSTKGAIAITPSTEDAFPISYTLAFDADGNNEFTLSDTYTSGVDGTPPHVEISNLAAGNYRISVSSSLGCNLKIFEFPILPCDALLALQLQEFRHVATTATQQVFTFKLNDAHFLKEAILEQSLDGKTFVAAGSSKTGSSAETHQEFTISTQKSASRFFRLRLQSLEGQVLYSPSLSLGTAVIMEQARAWPNPATDILNLSLPLKMKAPALYQIFNLHGRLVQQGTLKSDAVPERASLPVHQLPGGLYHITIFDSAQQPIRMRFVKR